MSEYHAPSLRELAAAHKEFEANEPRDLFYRAATELIELAIRGQTSSLSLVEAVAILLQTWNASYYRFHGKFDSQDFAQLEKAVRHDESLLMKFRDRTIADFTGRDEKTVRRTFARFEQVLGPVGPPNACACLRLRSFHSGIAPSPRRIVCPFCL